MAVLVDDRLVTRTARVAVVADTAARAIALDPMLMLPAPAQGALAVDVDGPPRPDPRDPALWAQREALKAALQRSTWPTCSRTCARRNTTWCA